MPATVTAFESLVRGTLTQQIADKGYAPSNNQLASSLHCSTEEIENALISLHASHSLLLHPHKVEPWVVHPFALYPASCWVKTDRRGYWATCLYCALGIAAALDTDVDIFTRFGGEGEQCIIRVREKNIVESDLVFHLSTPVSQWWDNVIHACALFQPFRNEDDIDAWCRRHDLPKGAVISMARLWRFACAWYGDYISQPWRKRSTDEVQLLLQSHGFTGDFWFLE